MIPMCFESVEKVEKRCELGVTSGCFFTSCETWMGRGKFKFMEFLGTPPIPRCKSKGQRLPRDTSKDAP